MSNRVRIGLMFLAGFSLSLVLSCCASQPVQSVQFPERHTHLGGPGYRVFDVDEVGSVDQVLPLQKLYRLAEECTGQTRSFSDVRVFSVSKIEVRTPTGWFNGPVGVWAIGTGWIYAVRNRPPADIARTIVHEFAHYLTQLHHPEINGIIAACNAYINERTNK